MTGCFDLFHMVSFFACSHIVNCLGCFLYDRLPWVILYGELPRVFSLWYVPCIIALNIHIWVFLGAFFTMIAFGLGYFFIGTCRMFFVSLGTLTRCMTLSTQLHCVLSYGCFAWDVLFLRVFLFDGVTSCDLELCKLSYHGFILGALLPMCLCVYIMHYWRCISIGLIKNAI